MKLRTNITATVLFALLAGLFLILGSAAQVVSSGEQGGQGEVAVEVQSIAPGRPVWLALRVDPEAGNYASWVDHVSGDTGVRVTLDLPEGFSKGVLVRPAPVLVEGENTFGYPARFWALQEILIARSTPYQGTYEITGSYGWHECSSGLNCQDATRNFAIQLPFGRGLPNPGVQDIFSTARGAAPGYLPWPVSYRADSEYIELELYLDQDTSGNIEAVYILPTFGMEKGNLRTKLDLFRTVTGVQLQGEAREEFLAGAKLDALLFITLKDGGSAVYQVNAKNRISEPTSFSLQTPGVANLGLWVALALAFLGGLILNLMPCVFPVLALKVFGVVKAGAVSNRRLRGDALAYTGGILLSFMIVALLLLTFRAGGEQVGWGFQLQSPYFITALALILFAVALSFAGLFELRLPFALSVKSETEGALGSFYTGMLATLVATPCTAPFMAPALGFALTQSTTQAVFIFLSLGLGLAAPYLLIGFIPGAARIFPKPGKWMETMKKILSIPVLLTVAWLMWVLYAQTGRGGVFIALLYMGLLAALVLWWTQTKSWPRARRLGGLGLASIAVLAVGYATLPPLGRVVERPAVVNAEEFSEGEIWNLRLQGKGVFVNYTATWCLTCIVNERLVFSRPKFRHFLAENNIVYMVADWTNPDDEIAKSLEALGRTALPVYAFYPPGGPTVDPVLLPEILTLEKALEILSSELP